MADPQDAAARREARARAWKSQVFRDGSFAAMDAASRRFWLEIPASERAAEVWKLSVEAFGLAVECPVLSIDDLIENKRAAGRPQDLADADELERIRSLSET